MYSAFLVNFTHYFHFFMASSNQVKLLEVCKVSPKLSSSSQTSLSLLFFDLFWLRFPPNQRVFFYQTSLEAGTLLAKLKNSLSLTLDYYLPLAGKLTWQENAEKPSVEYHPGDGVSLTIAESDANFDLLCSDGFREASLFYPLLPDLCCNTDTNIVPVISLQVTFFNNKGFSIGFSVHHAVMDGKSLSMFIHSWASVCKDDFLRDELVPVFDRDLVRVPSHLEGIYLKSLLEDKETNNRSLEMWDMKAPSDIVFGTFKLSFPDIEKFKTSVKSCIEKDQEKKLSFSTFVITSAFMLVCLYKTHKLSSDKVRLAINIDSRARLKPVVPSNYFGNCIAGCLVDLSTANLVKDNAVAIAAKTIAEALRGVDDTLLNGAETWISELSGAQADTVYSIAGSPHFKLYKADFGWGRPRKAEMISIAKTGAFSLSDDRDDNGGIEIGVALKQYESEDFASLFASGLDSIKMTI